jgi:hypothetical protein
VGYVLHETPKERAGLPFGTCSYGKLRHKDPLSSSFLDQVQNERAKSTTTQRRKRRKFNIPAGKSNTAEGVLGENQHVGLRPSTSRGPSAKNKFSKKGIRKKEEGSESDCGVFHWIL